MTLTTSTRSNFSTAAIAAGVLVLCTACGTRSPAPSAASAPTAQAAPTPAPAPAAPAKPVREGMEYAALSELIGEGTGKRVKQDLMGKTVSIDLAKASGRNVPAGAYAVDSTDQTFFVCRSVAPGYTGGAVTSKVRDYRYLPRTKQKVVDLDRCAPEVMSVAAAPSRPAAAAAPAPTAAAAQAAPYTGGAKPGIDAKGNVIDSSKVEAGSGRTVKGLNDYEGEITGNPAPGSKFTKLQIGMPTKQVTDLVGPPTDQGAYMTGKAWIPFYFGSDRHRFEMTYKGQGRLIFAGGGMGDFSNGYLIWIIHNPNEAGYR
ncbi:hypothetical protein BH11PSE13_BH11PSE13_20800 [soil metagenome]